MNISCITTKSFTKQEIIEWLDKNFDDYDRVAVVTKISEYKGESNQAWQFAKEIDL